MQRGGRGGGRFSPGGRGGRFSPGGRGGRFGGGRGGRGQQDFGPPEAVIEAGLFEHACEGEAVCKLSNEKIPYFNAPIFLENKTQIGRIEEIFGGINDAYFTIKMQEGIVATSYSSGDKFFIDPYKLLPLDRFLPKPKGSGPAGGVQKGGRGGGRGGRGGRGGGRGFSPGGRGRGGGRGGSFRGGRGGSGGFRGGGRGRGRF